MKNRLTSILKNLDTIIMCVFLVVIFLSLFMQVLMRYVFQCPLIWSEEIARYSYVWITMLALSYNQRRGNNVSMTLLTDRLPKLVQLILSVTTDIVVLIICGRIFPALIEFFELNCKIKSNVLGYSLGYVAVSVPLGFGLLILSLAIHCVRLVIEYRKEDNTL